MYKMNQCVRYSECGIDNALKISSLINYFQDCTTANSEQLGVGHSYLVSKQRAWILNSWQVEIKRLPKVHEKIEVSTWATGFHGILGPRDFCVKTTDGEVLAYAHSLWVYLDTESNRPTKPSDEEIAKYTLGDPLPMDSVPRKIKEPEGAIWVDTFPVHKYHIDTNHHVNNSKYVELACEALPDDFVVKKLRVEYKKSAVLGNTMALYREVEDTRVVAQLCDEDRNAYAIIEFIGEVKE